MEYRFAAFHGILKGFGSAHVAEEDVDGQVVQRMRLGAVEHEGVHRVAEVDQVFG